MYVYEFERVSCNLSGWGLGFGATLGIEAYQSIILARAKNNWRYIGFIPAVQRGTGHMEKMDLIFEQKQNENLNPLDDL